MKTNSRKARGRIQTQEIPVNDSPSNAKGDRLAVALFVGVLALSTALLGGGAFWSISGLAAAFRHPPVNWGTALAMLFTLAFSVLAARALAWMSVLGPILLATRMGAWRSLEAFASKGLPFAKLYPGGTAWLSTALIQSLVNRGQYEAALMTAEAEWQRSGSDDKQAQNLGTLCFAAGVAKQAQSDLKQAQVWNERAISVLNKSLEQLSKPQKGIMAKFAQSQTPQVSGQLKIQLAAAYFNNATIYFNNQDFRRAKENYRLAIDNAMKSPEFPQKAEIIRFGQEQMGRLKHT